MARKSRKNVEAPSVPAYQIFMYYVAIYIRLSVEDNKKRGNSIESQRSIIENFMALNPDFKLYDVYIDNGTTGVNFERDGFKRMMEDVEAGSPARGIWFRYITAPLKAAAFPLREE